MMIVEQVAMFCFRPGEEIIEANDLVAFAKQPLAKMRADKTGPAGDQDSIHLFAGVPNCEKICRGP